MAITSEEIQKLGLYRTKEWIFFYKYSVSKANNDLRLYRDKLKKLTEHFKNLKKNKILKEVKEPEKNNGRTE